jgi:hypothetical protein
MITLFYLVCFLCVVILLLLLVLEIQKQKRPGYRPPRARRKAHLDERLQRELEMLAGHPKTARRLVAGVKRNNPRQPLRWCQEKAIADLERDRRA